MNLVLLACLYTGLFSMAFQTVRNAGRAGPAGRKQGLPTYQRRTLVALTCLLICTVVDTYVMSRGLTAPRPALWGLAAFDAVAVLAVLGALTGLRRDADRGNLALAGLSLSALATVLYVIWGALAFSWTRPDGSEFLDGLAASWGTSPAVVGFIALVHYAAAPVLAAVTLAGRDRWPELPSWKKDHAWRGLSNTSSLLALVYLLFTWAVLRS